MKRNNTKKALVLSAISILICIAMLIGSTWAWFTDTATTAVNTIQSGILDVGLEHKVGEEWKDAEGQTLAWVQSASCQNGKGLWEPGCTYALEPVKVVNKGNLSLKYKISVTGVIDADGAKLMEVIDWTIKIGEAEAVPLDDYEGVLYPADAEEGEVPEGGSSESGEITIIGHMREEAGNEYQDLSLGEGVGITVFATQYAWECDSYGNQYDKDAPMVDVTDVSGLIEALNSPEDLYIFIENDIFNNDNGCIYHPVVREGANADKATTFAKIPENTTKIIDFNGHTLKFKTNNVKNVTGPADGYSIIDNKGELILTNTAEEPGGIELTHEGENMYWKAESTIIWVHNGTVTVEDNVTLEHKGGTDMAYAIDLIGNNPVTVNIEGGTVKSVYRAIRQFANNQSNTVNISGGEVIGGNGGTAVWIQHFDGTATLNITGGTLKTMDGMGRIVYIYGGKFFEGSAGNGNLTEEEAASKAAWQANENNKIVVNINSSAQILANNADNENDYGNIVVYQGETYIGQLDDPLLYNDKIQITREEGVTLVNEGGGSTYVACYFVWENTDYNSPDYGGYYVYVVREPEVSEATEP